MPVRMELSWTRREPFAEQIDVAVPCKLLAIQAVDQVGYLVFLVPGLGMSVDEERAPWQLVIIVDDIGEIYYGFVTLSLRES